MYPRPLSLLFGIVFGILCVSASVFAGQIKTAEFFIGATPDEITAPVELPFTLYIGDSIANVTDPIKSGYAAISGIYSGGGSVSVTLDGDSSTTVDFFMPAVFDPRPFELVFPDRAGLLQVATAGSYEHTLSVVPAGVSIASLSAKAVVTHELDDAACSSDASGEAVKSSDFFIGERVASFASATTMPFSVYIGDSMADASNGVVSADVTISGMYQGSGSLNVSVGQTTKAYVFPAVTAPTFFEIVHDASAAISPESPGTFSYDLELVPSGLTITGLSAYISVAHSFEAPACSGYPAKGQLYSKAFDATATSSGPAYNSISWRGVLGGPGANQGKVRFELAASNCANGASNYPACSTGTWNFIGGTTCSATDWFDPGQPDTAIEITGQSCRAELYNKRYIRYVIEVCSSDCTAPGAYTPEVEEVLLNWSP
jgi:hypothetical protein